MGCARGRFRFIQINALQSIRWGCLSALRHPFHVVHLRYRFTVLGNTGGFFASLHPEINRLLRPPLGSGSVSDYPTNEELICVSPALPSDAQHRASVYRLPV